MEKKLKEDEQNDLMSPTETNKTLISSPKGETLNIEESPLKNDVPVKPQLKLNEVENEDTLATEEPPASFELEPDSYIYLMMTSRRIILALLLPFSILALSSENFKKKSDCLFLPFYILFILFFFVFVYIYISLLAMPGYFVPIVQIVSLSSIKETNFPDHIIEEENKLFSAARVLISMILVVMLFGECSQAINNICLALNRIQIHHEIVEKIKKQQKLSKDENTQKNIKTKKGFYDYKWNIFVDKLARKGEIFPGFVQLGVTLVIEYYSIVIIYNTQDSISLIQNFAGLAILLDFDVFVIRFLKKSGFGEFILNQIKKSEKKFREKMKVDTEIGNSEVEVLEKHLEKQLTDTYWQLFNEDKVVITKNDKNGWIFRFKKLMNWIIMLALILMSFAPSWNR